MFTKMVRKSWADFALCRPGGPNNDVDFFPTEGGNTKRAIAVCKRCPAREACLEFALSTNQEHGVWGGASERQRRRLRRLRRFAPAQPKPEPEPISSETVVAELLALRAELAS